MTTTARWTSSRSPIGGRHRRRAGLLGLAAALVVLMLAAGSLVLLRQRVTGLSARPAVQVADAVGVLALGALALALLWCTVLLSACAVDLLRQPHSPGQQHGRTAGRRAAQGPLDAAPVLAGRITALLLALTALGSTAGAASAMPAPATGAAVAAAPATVLAPAPAAALVLAPRSVPAPISAPEPTFGAALPSTTAPVGETCAPAPGWTAPRPAAVRARGADELHLLSGCPRGIDRTDRPEVVVHRGDDLWSIVQRHLGPEADAARVAAEWPRWYAANRAIIGDDPNLLLCGLTLHAPEGALR